MCAICFAPLYAKVPFRSIVRSIVADAVTKPVFLCKKFVCVSMVVFLSLAQRLSNVNKYVDIDMWRFSVAKAVFADISYYVLFVKTDVRNVSHNLPFCIFFSYYVTGSNY